MFKILKFSSYIWATDRIVPFWRPGVPASSSVQGLATGLFFGQRPTSKLGTVWTVGSGPGTGTWRVVL